MTLKKSFNFNFYSDPGHGWIACKIKILEDLKIDDKISSFSYRKGQTAYLEEDCDAAVLINALSERGIGYMLTEKHTNKSSPIRSYRRY